MAQLVASSRAPQFARYICVSEACQKPLNVHLNQNDVSWFVSTISIVLADNPTGFHCMLTFQTIISRKQGVLAKGVSLYTYSPGSPFGLLIHSNQYVFLYETVINTAHSVAPFEV